MGNCCISTTPQTKKKFALKLPHYTQYLRYDTDMKDFELEADINVWIQNLYCTSYYTNWIVYNDDVSMFGNNHTTHGHCKGIVTWNDNNIGWLCHSVPNFPRKFTGNSISMVEPSELIYGQSFQYIEIPFNKDMLHNIMHHINIMDSNIYISNYTPEYKEYKNMKFPKIYKFNLLKIDEDIIHIAKPHVYTFDIYSDYITKNSSCRWRVETWQRGHLINTVTPNMIDIKKLKFNDITYTSHMDHSKWAVSNDSYYWIGDLNRMTSQFKRGGGGFICRDIDLTRALNRLVLE